MKLILKTRQNSGLHYCFLLVVLIEGDYSVVVLVIKSIL